MYDDVLTLTPHYYNNITTCDVHESDENRVIIGFTT